MHKKKGWDKVTEKVIRIKMQRKETCETAQNMMAQPGIGKH
jgi:uracil DNA glycosylase